jgi:hypothetical protein
MRPMVFHQAYCRLRFFGQQLNSTVYASTVCGITFFVKRFFADICGSVIGNFPVISTE